MIVLQTDFFLQIVIVLLQLLAQLLDLGECRSQLLVGFPALGDIAKHDHGTDETAAVADRGRGVFDEEACAVLAPEHLAVDLMHGAVPERCVDWALRCRIIGAVGMGVMHDRMHVLADEILDLPAQHAFSRRIDEGGLAVSIYAVDAFAGRAQDQLVLALDVAENPFDPLPFLDAAADMKVGFGIDRAAPQKRQGLSTSEAIAVRRRRPARCRNIRVTIRARRRGGDAGYGSSIRPWPKPLR